VPVERLQTVIVNVVILWSVSVARSSPEQRRESWWLCSTLSTANRRRQRKRRAVSCNRSPVRWLHAMVISFCMVVCLSVRSSVCRLWNLLSHSPRGSTWRRAEAYRIDSDTLVEQEQRRVGFCVWDRGLSSLAGHFRVIFLLGSDICAEIRQRDDVTHLTTVYFALYKSTHYY